MGPEIRLARAICPGPCVIYRRRRDSEISEGAKGLNRVAGGAGAAGAALLLFGAITPRSRGTPKNERRAPAAAVSRAAPFFP